MHTPGLKLVGFLYILDPKTALYALFLYAHHLDIALFVSDENINVNLNNTIYLDPFTLDTNSYGDVNINTIYVRSILRTQVRTTDSVNGK